MKHGALLLVLLAALAATNALALRGEFEEDALTPPPAFEPLPPGVKPDDAAMRFRQTPVTTVTTTPSSGAAPTPITTVGASGAADGAAAAAPSTPAPAPAVPGASGQQNGTAATPVTTAAPSTPRAPTRRKRAEPKPVMEYATMVRQSLGNADRSLNRVRELYEAFVKALYDQDALMQKQKLGFKDDKRMFNDALTAGSNAIKNIGNALSDIPDVRAKLRATFRALGRNADGSVPVKSTGAMPSLLEVGVADSERLAAVLSVDARMLASVRTMSRASNILERVQEALAELFDQAEAMNQGLQDNMARAKADALTQKDFVPGMLGELDMRNKLNEKFITLLQSERNIQLTKFREMEPYFLEVEAQAQAEADNATASNNTAAGPSSSSPNATSLQPNMTSVTSLTTPITSSEPKSPVHPGVYWPSLMRYLREMNQTVFRQVLNAMDWHTKIFKAHNDLKRHYNKMIENYVLIMNEARAQLTVIESTCRSVRAVKNQFAQIDADPNVPQFVKDDYKDSYVLITKILATNAPQFRAFYKAKQNLLDLVKPMGDSYYVYRKVVVASRNLLTAMINQIIDEWRKVAAVAGSLRGSLKPEIKRLASYTFHF